jgi:hypothetical protein
VIKLRDVIAAEEAVETAEAEYRKLNNDPREWAAFESVDRFGKRSLNVLPGQFERLDAARNRITAAEQQLLAVKRAFMAGVVDDRADR